MPKKKNKHKAITIKKPVITFIVITIILLSIFLFWYTIIWPAVKTCIGCHSQTYCAAATQCSEPDEEGIAECHYYNEKAEISKDTIKCYIKKD